MLFGRGKRLPSPKCLVITGATAGIGEALALHYAKPGITLALTGRNEARLDAVARACTERSVALQALHALRRSRRLMPRFFLQWRGREEGQTRRDG